MRINTDVVIVIRRCTSWCAGRVQHGTLTFGAFTQGAFNEALLTGTFSRGAFMFATFF